MPRDIPIGNGHLLVNFDDRHRLRDIYFPHVGAENQSDGHPFRVGIWVDVEFSWLDDDAWSVTQRYAENTLVTDATLRNAALGISIECAEAVDFHENALVRRFTVQNGTARQREARLFPHHDFHIKEQELGDTAYYDPAQRALIHYKDDRWFLANGRVGSETAGFDQWAVGTKESGGKEGTWRDAEDGSLSGNAVVQGSVDSVGALHFSLPPNGSATVWSWIACGFALGDVATVNAVILDKGPEELHARTRAYWRLWAAAEPSQVDALTPDVAALFQRSLLIVRSHIDYDGGIIAATDYDITAFARDTYAYVWPRDGALVAHALDDAGYDGTTRPFYDFLSRVQDERGYFMHKFNPDGTLASSWHPWFRNGERELPIQEDETGLPLWALWHHFDKFHDVEFVKPFYRKVIRGAGEFMAEYVDDNGLPRPSYDPWEERWGVHAWNVAATWAGLMAAARFFAVFGDRDDAERMALAANRMRRAASEHLWSQQHQRYVRSITPNANGTYDADLTVDSSVCGLFLFGMYDAADERIACTMRNLREKLWVNTPIGGLARYENDGYQRAVNDPAIPGNPWFVSTLWLAQWQIRVAASLNDLDEPAQLLSWVAARSLASGVLAEQVHPYDGHALSVSPLTWSHGTFIQAVVDYLKKRETFDVCPTCGQARTPRDRVTYLTDRLDEANVPNDRA
jgi:glucoamylase